LPGTLGGTVRAQTTLVAARAGDLAAVRASLATGPALVGPRDEGVNTPLHLAEREGDDDVVKFLLATGADVIAANCEHETPLHWAVLRSRQDVNLLLRHGGTTEARESYGPTPLGLSAGWLQHLEGHVADQLRVGGAADLALPIRADRGDDATVGEDLPGLERAGSPLTNRGCRRRSAHIYTGIAPPPPEYLHDRG